jgi:hypothetical protein
MTRALSTIIWAAAGALCVLTFVSMLGCASSGLYTMSDEWCAAHPGAPPSRCNRNPLKEYDVQGHQLVGPEWSMCPGQYTLGAYGVTITCWGEK